DISLVLIIFFLMTSSLAAKAAVDPSLHPDEAPTVTEAKDIDTPPAWFGRLKNDPDQIWIGIDVDQEGSPVYSLGRGTNPPARARGGLMTQAQLLERLDAHLKEIHERVDVTIRANKDLRAGVVRKVQVALEKRPQISRKFIGVQQKASP